MAAVVVAVAAEVAEVAEVAKAAEAAEAAMRHRPALRSSRPCRRQPGR
jgi:hypothetical protein